MSQSSEPVPISALYPISRTGVTIFLEPGEGHFRPKDPASAGMLGDLALILAGVEDSTGFHPDMNNSGTFDSKRVTSLRGEFANEANHGYRLAVQINHPGLLKIIASVIRTGKHPGSEAYIRPEAKALK